ncbi:hypothetical protein [Paenibacillus sp. Y412MC10]|uniref:hypothetical protein n=1 Tax=Geobacillus sp. (strain Y412MC10) TaxID=481743 RepID=UPI0011A2503D|nr:hypothetical protein [Paenibacillus sp. Y412MC10]
MKRIYLSLLFLVGIIFAFGGIASADAANETTYSIATEVNLQPSSVEQENSQSPSVEQENSQSPSVEQENLQDPSLEPYSEIGPTYPSTNITMKAGDVIYNPKTVSTFFVGHVAIVGTDLRLYHSHPLGPGISEGINSYVSRFSSGDQFNILRPRDGYGASAASWAQNNIGRIQSYAFYPSLSDVTANYCSKFVWQAYWFGEHKDIARGNPYSDIMVPPGMVSIYPYEIRDSSAFVKMGSFNK